MRKIYVLWFALAMTALLTCSCNKNQLDFSQMDSVEASGQWKLPIGSARITLERVLGQFAHNDYVSYDEDGHIQLSYRFTMDTVVKGDAFMKYDDMNFNFTFTTENPDTTIVIGEPVDAYLYFDQDIELQSDVLRLYSGKIRSGSFVFYVFSNLVDIEDITITSPSVYDADGTPFKRVILSDQDYEIDLAGVYFEAFDDDTEHFDGDKLRFHYEIHYLAQGVLAPELTFDTRIGIRNLCVQELTGSISSYATGFNVDETISLPLNNISGDLKFVDARLKIMQRNTFDMSARIRIDTAMLLGEHVTPTMIFDNYPVSIDVGFSPSYSDAFEERISIDLNSDFGAVYASGEFVLNPSGFGETVTLYDTASIGLAAEGVLPMKFNIPGVVYRDTIDLNMSDVKAPEMIKEVLLHIAFDSELPFNLKAQMYTYNSRTGQVTDSIFSDSRFIDGSFANVPVRTQLSVSMNHDRLDHLMAADKLLINLGVDTDNRDVYLDLEDALGVTLKADVVYDGDVMDLK